MAASVGLSRSSRAPFEDACEDRRQLLRREAERCFRLACGVASPELAEELEKIGRAFEREAAILEGAP